jgi:hypothetical protein
MYTHTQDQERPELTPPECYTPTAPSPALLPTSPFHAFFYVMGGSPQTPNVVTDEKVMTFTSSKCLFIMSR